MRLSQSLTKTRKDAPKDEQALNAQLLIKAGYIHKEMAGVYTFLPLGKRVLDNIVKIIREEMNAIGGQELYLSALQSSEPWQKSGRWSDEVIDVWFKTKLANGTELGLAPTHEEPLAAAMASHISSYTDLPKYAYQFQYKFRNELRSKSGLMRGREFMMKDLYSFSRDKAEHDEFYERCAEAYMKIYDRLGLGGITYRTFASGGSFAKFSDEFQTLSEVGEDVIYIDKAKNMALNEEVYTDEIIADLGLNKAELVQAKAVEVGNIFTLGTQYSEAEGLMYATSDGKSMPVFMGSYGIGPSRIMGLIAEHFADESGLVWPLNIAPYQICIIQLGESQEVVSLADKIYADLAELGLDVMIDDRDTRPGSKFADAELLGIPYSVVVSDRAVKSGKLELKTRADSFVTEVNIAEAVQNLNSLCT